MAKNYMKRKDRIILTAVEIIDQLGVQGLTIREIASRQEISEAAIYRHFANKTEILLGTIDYFSSYDTLLFRTIESQNMKAWEGITFLLASYTEYYENYPAISAVTFTQEAFQLEPEARQRMENVIDNRLRFINQMVIKGQKEGEFTRDICSERIVDIIFGTVQFIILRWRAKNYDFALKEQVLSTLSVLIEAFSTVKLENRFAWGGVFNQEVSTSAIDSVLTRPGLFLEKGKDQVNEKIEG